MSLPGHKKRSHKGASTYRHATRSVFCAAQLNQMLGKDYLVRNFGISGRIIINKGDNPYMKEKIYQDALKFLPDIVIIKLGTNDSKPQNWKYKNDFKSDLETMIQDFQALSSRPKI